MSLGSCQLCKSIDLFFDDRLGEMVCNSCGAVNVVAPFEETIAPIKEKRNKNNSNLTDVRKSSRGHLGSWIKPQDTKTKYDRTLMLNHIRTTSNKTIDNPEFNRLTAMYLSNYTLDSDRWGLIDRAKREYRIAVSERTLRGYPTTLKAAGITYYVLREAGIVTSLRTHAKYTREKHGDIARVAKRIATFNKKAYIFSNVSLMDRLVALMQQFNLSVTQREACFKLGEYVSRVLDDLSLPVTNNRVAALMWIATSIVEEPIIQTKIAGAWHASDIGLRTMAKELCEILKIDRKKFSSYDIDDIIIGIRVNGNENCIKQR